MDQSHKVKTKKAVTWEDLGISDSQNRFGVIGTVADRAREAGAKIVSEALMRPTKAISEAWIDQSIMNNFWGLVVATFFTFYFTSTLIYAGTLTTSILSIEDAEIARASLWQLLIFVLTVFNFIYTLCCQLTMRQWGTGILWKSLLFGAVTSLGILTAGYSTDIALSDKIGGGACLMVFVTLASLAKSCEYDRCCPGNGKNFFYLVSILPAIVSSFVIPGRFGLGVMLTFQIMGNLFHWFSISDKSEIK